ncbi:putative nephronectin-like [Scophthalmus maximus]|uniref:Putative nephronectin-like n=1 Tax=Scophthalmus maximus TaxID=52904 RepID=A0A2U9B049_SCOMX|nr:putative nephronectin-like [Scophthalmus maximus]
MWKKKKRSIRPSEPVRVETCGNRRREEGLCRYGNSVECCWGWRPMDRGRCQREDASITRYRTT